ncbi:hypothetical protein QQF64_025871 [Cirrhinus molitorella]|uniref:Uncharacterized protein n=1 Tax=Cirrhinus molitorella TaxID=172907 RepID=A0ABR3NQB8_9TELE
MVDQHLEDDLYTPECQQRPHQLDEWQRRIISEDLVTLTAVSTRPRCLRRHPDPVCIQIRWSLQFPGSSLYLAQMVDQHLEMTSTALNVNGDRVN